MLPPLVDLGLAVIILVWLINLFNFMDGIDGISGVEAVIIGVGILAAGLVTNRLGGTEYLGLLAAVAGLGFLSWNWPPARIFLGDVGSTPLGFLLGWLLINGAAQGLWLSALILPLYYLADSGLTLMRRLMRGENIAQAHRFHFYQKAVQNGRSHAQVSAAVLGLGLVLIGHAAIAAKFDTAVAWPALLSAMACVGLLLAWMAAPWRGNGGDS